MQRELIWVCGLLWFTVQAAFLRSVSVVQVSRRVKGLREAISSAKHEAGQLTAEQQHLRRQQSSLHERIQRMQHQVILLITYPNTSVKTERVGRELLTNSCNALSPLGLE